MSDNENRERLVYIEDEVKSSYLDYAMSVIIGRALPDVRDGLKPVHRRILYAMNETGMSYDKPFKKSARIVGEVLGKYHPHGDSSVYLAMVRMAQKFNMRYPLVASQGNFGSIDGDSPAHMRYTEAKLSKLSEEMLRDIDKDTVKFKNNFDDSLTEPEVLPTRIPNLLLNGSSGIAVGMATNIPPHNLGEVIDALIACIDNPEITIYDIMEHIKAPDFPTGGIISGTAGVKEAYRTGRGKLRIRGKAKIETTSSKGEAIIIEELPYQVNKSDLVIQIAELSRDKKINGIGELRDESTREGIRVFIEVKKGENAELILNKLYKYTNLEVSFGIIMIAIVNNVPKVLNLQEILNCFLGHRFEVVTNRTRFELDKAEKKAHILEGLRKALNDIDNVIREIKASKDTKEAKERLMLNFGFSEEQAKALLEMKLQRLTNLEMAKLEEEYQMLMQDIERYKLILGSKEAVYEVIKAELLEIKDRYADPRLTDIEDELHELDDEDLISDEDVLVSVTNNGYVKRIPLDNYEAQNRGGKGYSDHGILENDFIKHIYTAKNLDSLLIFTDKGKVYKLKVYQIPETGKTAKGKLLSNLIGLDENEKLKSVIKVREFSKEKSIFFVTRKGIVKKSSLDLFSNINKAGKIAIKMREGDDLVNSFITQKGEKIFLATKLGQCIMFKGDSIRSLGRNSSGVIGMRLKEKDFVVSGVIITEATEQDSTVLTISKNGYGKRTKLENYKVISRGRKGVINLKVTKKTGEVVGAEEILADDELMIITSKGSLIRLSANDISVIGRATQGVKLMKIRGSEEVVDFVKISQD